MRTRTACRGPVSLGMPLTLVMPRRSIPSAWSKAQRIRCEVRFGAVLACHVGDIGAQRVLRFFLRPPIRHSSPQPNNTIISYDPRAMARNTSIRQITSQQDIGGPHEDRHSQTADPRLSVALARSIACAGRDQCPKGRRTQRKCLEGKSW